jgi:hypothetical protein
MSNHEECEPTMIGATTTRALAAGGSRRRWIPALAGLGIVALAATACSSSGTTSTPPLANANSTSPSPATSQGAFPGVTGTAAAVSASSMEVQNTSGQVTVTFTTSTPIRETVTAAAGDIKVGSCVTVIGQPSSTTGVNRSVTATTVTITTPVNGSCEGGFGGFGGPGGLGGRGGTASPRPSFSARPRPSGTRGAGTFGGANGKVTSLSASGFVVQGRNLGAGAGGAGGGTGASGAAGADISTTVTTTATTKYQKTVTAHSSALKVGLCITAIGSANSIGAIAARDIQISQPGPNGCVTSFAGRPGGFGSSSGGPAGNA